MLKKLALPVLGILFIAAPVLATTNPIDELQSQIQSLLAQIAQLKLQLNVKPSVNAATLCLNLKNPLVIGSTDEETNGEVSKLQRFLIDESGYTGPVSGYYGQLTAQAVMRWQKAHGMDFVTLKSGVGPMTRTKIRERCGPYAVISGEYEYSDMAGFSTFRTANGPFGTPAVIRENTKGRQPETDTPPGTMEGFSLHNDIVGTLHQLGDTCSLVIEAKVEIANPQQLGILKDSQGYNVIGADFVRLVSKGGVFDNCSNGNGTSTRTERKIAQCAAYNSKSVITSVTPSSGPVGTTIEVQGCNFLGFESDKILWFMNSGGMKGVLHGESDPATRTSNTVMRVTVPQTLCQNDNSYSGLPCSAFLNFVPGVYTVYSSSYGGNSNAVNFTVTER